MLVDRCNVLFYPRGQTKPLQAGELRLLPGLKGSVFRYLPAYLEHRDAIAFDPLGLPLSPDERMTMREADWILPDAIGDAGPDTWGKSVIDRVSKLERSSEFDYLLAAGPNRIGALDFSVADGVPSLVTADLKDLVDIEAAIDQVKKKLPVEDHMRHLLAPGASLGGVRPKTVVQMEGELWIAKFNARDEDFDAVSLEYAGMRLAHQAGLSVANVRKHQFSDTRAALLVLRFDRESLADNEFGRIPYISARTLLRGYARQILAEAKARYSYLLLTEAMRLIGSAEVLNEDLRELFRRMVFNVLVDNTDDHESNFGFVYTGGWRLSRAFDISPQLTTLGYQQMEVGASYTESSLQNALTACARFGLQIADAVSLVEGLIDATQAMGDVYRECGIDGGRVDRAVRYRERLVSEFRKVRPSLLKDKSQRAIRETRADRKS
jgi:serine/threonine-protein kinase HipA